MSHQQLFERLYCLGAPFHNVSPEETRAAILERLKAREPGMAVITPNLDFLRVMETDARLRRSVMEGDLVIADGMPAVVWLRMQGHRITRVTGSDLTRDLFGICAEHGFSVYVLGAAPSSVEKALSKMKAMYPHLRIAGNYSPPVVPLAEMNIDDIADRISKAKPDLVFVAMGMGKQEAAIHALRRRVNVSVWLGIGGSIDFIAGVQKRAPVFFQKIGLEWFWRMAMQPKRLFGRYFKDGLWLTNRIVKQLLLLIYSRIGGHALFSVPFEMEDISPEEIIRLPRMNTKQDQEDFINLVQNGTFSYLDLSGYERLNPMELAVLSLTDAKCLTGEIPLLQLCGLSKSLRLQLRIEHLFRTDPLLQDRGSISFDRPWSLFIPAHLFAAAGLFLGLAFQFDAVGLLIGFLLGIVLAFIPRIFRTFGHDPVEVFDHLDHEVLFICQNGVILSTSSNTIKLLGCAEFELRNHQLSELFPEIDTADTSPRICDTVLIGRYKRILPVRVQFLQPADNNLQCVLVSSQHSQYERARKVAHFEERRRRIIDHLCNTLEADAIKEGNHSGACFGTILIRSNPVRGDFVCRIFANESYVSLVIGDVSGCGDDAVILGNVLKNEVYRTISELMMASLSHERPAITSVIGTLDVALTRYLMEMGALFAFGAILFNRKTGQLDYVSCGIPCLMQAHASTGQVTRLPLENIPLGILPRQPLKVETIILEPGDTVLFATDGLIHWHENSKSGTSLENLFAKGAKERDAAAISANFRAIYEAESDPTRQLSDDIALAFITRETL